VNQTVAAIVAGQIRVSPTFADSITCARLGGRYSTASRTWVFPATQQTARRLRAGLPKLQPTPEFEFLISGARPMGASELSCQSEVTAAGTEADLAAVAAPEQPAIVPPTVAVAAPQATVAVAVAEPEIEIVVPDGILTRPWRHQRAAFKFCLEHFEAGYFGLLLAMGMGTGKTLVAIMLLLWAKARRVLIACPLRVVPVWVAQIAKHCSAEMLVVALDETVGSVAEKQALAAEKMRLAQARGIPFVAVINYDSGWRDPFAAWAAKQLWDAVFLDEGHRIKQPSGKASKFVSRLRPMAKIRVALTGTPMPHGPMDLFALVRALDLRIYGPSFAAFRQKYAEMGGYQNKQIIRFQREDELQRLLGMVTFRVGKEVLDLPPETDVTYHCDLCPEARRVYKELDQDLVADVLDGRITAANCMVKVLRLEQVSGGIAKTDDGVERRIDDSKLRLLADTLDDIDVKDAAVVFCWFHQDLDAVHEAARLLGTTSLELSGRRDDLSEWQAGKAQVLAVQIQAGGEGVDLTRARYSIFYSVGYSLGKYMQARSRTHRPGQLNPVEHIHLIARNTVDVRIMRALEKRAEIVESILAEIKNTIGGIHADEQHAD
jgi:SNF2 family DNA or RNA helicase